MEHETTNTGSFAELPQPQEASDGNKQETGPAPQPERRGSNMPSISSQPDPQKVQALADPQQSQPANPTPTNTPTMDPGSAALIADDTDLIEKEWVVRAKAIVAQTRDDPHQQNREMNKVKADYLKKRYNKDLKTNEG